MTQKEVERIRWNNWQAAKPLLTEAAKSAGVDPEIIVRMAYFESRFRTNVGPSTSTAYGLGQFTKGTWLDVLRKHGEKYGIKNAAQLTMAQALAYRDDARLQAAMLAEFTQDNIKRVQGLGRKGNIADVYSLHNLGSGGGPKFLKALMENPNAKVSSVLSQKVIKNNSILYGDGSISLADAYGNMNQYLSGADKYVNDIIIPVSEFQDDLSSDSGKSNNAGGGGLVIKPSVVTEQPGSYTPPLITKDIEDSYEGYKYGKGRGTLKDGTQTIDCSHLVNEILKRYGYKIPYQNTAALKNSKFFDEIDAKDVKPGDIALWNGHTAIVQELTDPEKGIGTVYGSHLTGGPSSVTMGPDGLLKKLGKPKTYLRPRVEYLNQAAPKNATAAQKKPSPPKVVPAPVAAKNSTSIAEEKNTPSGYDLLNSMMSVLKHLSVPNLQHASQALLARQPEDYRSAKGGGCCCASGPPSTVINQNTSITLNSACKDPQELGNIVANAQDKVNRDVVRKIIPRTS
ncbi:hypothetical protein [Serratia sp. Ag1]|uniref:hypothetical protein n=1 Tax=Serratia sp. Ag1 TaxID=1524467 RepID=UPI0012686973|nr:hypothetical protein [Serratia sp. Ag1]